MISNVENLFPGYQIFGNNREGVEYAIESKRIDLLLENKDTNTLKIVELKAGAVDFRVFGQISMYLGFMGKKFPDKNIEGVIIAGDIDKSLLYACQTTNKVKVLRYEMKLLMEEIEI
ncbi:MAG: endonuclease NucS [Kiritimatiellaeota bacterium]|nr:endonuclease NucS [Kiritimatiellota bacterium]